MAGDFWKPLRDLTFEDVDTLRGSGDRERSILDYKRFDSDLTIDSAKLADDFGAFANSGGGRLVIGAIEKDERLVSFKGVPEKHLRRTFSTIRNTAHRVQPPVDLDVRELMTPDDEFVFLIEIRPGQAGPFQFQGRYLQRATSGNVAMSHTSVVNAVQAASRSVGGYGESSALTEGSVTLADSPDITVGRVWGCGVELRPAYTTPKAIYDPLDPRIDGVMEWLLRRRLPDVKRRFESLQARNDQRESLELTRNGWARGIIFQDASEQGSAIQLGNVETLFEGLIEDCAGCLNEIEPYFTVFVAGRVWGVEGKGLQVVWRGPVGDKKVPISKATPFLHGDREYRVHDLVDVASRTLAKRFCEYIKVHVQS
jgi:Schlafen, AlbA_2